MIIGNKIHIGSRRKVHIGTRLNPLIATLEATGGGSGVSTMRLEVTEEQTISVDGSARFYTDSAGTLNESTTWTVTPGALRTIYLKCSSGTANLIIPKPWKVVKWGDQSTDGWSSLNNSPKITINLSKIPITEIRVVGNAILNGRLSDKCTIIRLELDSVFYNHEGAFSINTKYIRISGANINWTYTGNLPKNISYALISGANINWTYTGNLPESLGTIWLSGANINWTGLNISGDKSISILNLLNYRTSKMSSADMVTLLTSLTNRVGGLPATITINDYADYASPPVEVTDAVALLKSTKSVTTVNLGA